MKRLLIEAEKDRRYRWRLLLVFIFPVILFFFGEVIKTHMCFLGLTIRLLSLTVLMLINFRLWLIVRTNSVVSVGIFIWLTGICIQILGILYGNAIVFLGSMAEIVISLKAFFRFRNSHVKFYFFIIPILIMAQFLLLTGYFYNGNFPGIYFIHILNILIGLFVVLLAVHPTIYEKENKSYLFLLVIMSIKLISVISFFF